MHAIMFIPTDEERGASRQAYSAASDSGTVVSASFPGSADGRVGLYVVLFARSESAFVGFQRAMEESGYPVRYVMKLE